MEAEVEVVEAVQVSFIFTRLFNTGHVDLEYLLGYRGSAYMHRCLQSKDIVVITDSIDWSFFCRGILRA